MKNGIDNTSSLSESAGTLIAESLYKKGMSEALSSYGITFKEDVSTTTASGAYTTLLRDTLFEAMIQNIEDVLELVDVDETLMEKAGGNALKIPRLQPTTAAIVAEGSVISYYDEGIDSITVTPQKRVVGTKITWEILNRGMTDFVNRILRQAAQAITARLASDILNGLVAGADTGNAEAGAITYDKVVNAQTNVENAKYSNGQPYGFIATHLVLARSALGVLTKTTEWKNHVYYANLKPANEVIINRASLMFGNLKIVSSPFLTSADGFVIDATKAALLVKESDLETYEQPLPGAPYDKEIVALMSYVLAVVYPKAIATINKA
jgi:hypothetical protein